MSRLNIRPKTWGLRARLLAPLIVITIGAVVTLVITTELSARGQSETLMRERGAAALEGIAQRLQERQKSLELLTQLLARQRSVVTAVEQRDDVSLAQELRPLTENLELGSVEVYSADQERLLHLGPVETATDMQRLIVSALSGGTHSTSQVSDEGLAVLASTPIEGPEGVVGALVVDTGAGGDALREAKAVEGVELAVFLDGTLIGTSVADPDLVHSLRGSKLTPERSQELNRATNSFNFHVVTRSLEGQGVLVALIRTNDLAQGAGRSDLLLSPVVLLQAIATICMLLVAFILARDMSATLEAVVKLSREIVRGNYSQRLPASHVREVNELSRAFNSLGTQLGIQRKKLEAQAFYDPLTGLPNRDLFLNRLNHALARAARNNSRVAVLFVDLDNFKLVNDSLGHQAGDLLLMEVAKRLRLSLRDVDTAARLGGDEFTILIEDAADENAVVNLAERLQARIQEPSTVIGQRMLITASIGITFSGPNHDGPDVLLWEADAAMYGAKLSGKARCEVFDDTTNGKPEEYVGPTSDQGQASSIESEQEPTQFLSHMTPGYRQVTLPAWARDEGPMPGVTPDLLANCLADVSSGRMTLEAYLAAHSAEADELRQLLETAAAIMPVPLVHPALAFPVRDRAALAEAISGPRTVTRKILRRFWSSVAAGWRDLTRPIAGMPAPAPVIALVFVLTTVAGGGATYASQSALPGDALYPVKMTVEELQFTLAPGEEGKTEAKLGCAGRRLDEAEQAINVGRSNAAESAIEAYTNCVAQAQQHLGQAEASGRDVGEVAVGLSESLSGHQTRLEGIGNRVPEPARAVLAKAAEETGKGLHAATALAGRKPRNDGLTEASHTLPPIGIVTTLPTETAGSDRDERRDDPARTTAISSSVAVILTQTISDIQDLKNDSDVSGDNQEGLLAKLSAVREALDRSLASAAADELEAFLSQLNTMQRSGHISGGNYAALYADYGSLVSEMGMTPRSQEAPGNSISMAGPNEDKSESGDRPDQLDNQTVVTPTVAPGLTGQRKWTYGHSRGPGEQDTLVASPTSEEAPGASRPDKDKSPGHEDDSQPQDTPVVEPTHSPRATSPAPDTDTRDRPATKPDVAPEQPAPAENPKPPTGPAPQAPVPPSGHTDRQGDSKSR